MDLNAQWEQLRREEPHLRVRDAARRLGVSEAELVATQSNTKVLAPRWVELLQAFRRLGRVMALTRNEACVHEKEGAYLEVRMDNPHVGGVYGPDIDLRLFPGTWGVALATSVPSRKGPLRSIQVFDRHGDAVHKIYAVDDTDRGAWEALEAEFLADPAPSLTVEPRPSPVPPGEVLQRDALLADWAEMKDTHDFYHLLKRHGVGRLAALRAAEGSFTEEVDPAFLTRLLEVVSTNGTPIMVFVGNRGCLQIHKGAVHRIVRKDGWLNVLDPGFNLHLREELVASTWIVRKPTTERDVTSVELLDQAGEPAALLFGVRKEGTPESKDWRQALDAARPPGSTSAVEGGRS